MMEYKEFTLDKSHDEVVEHNITPPLRDVITLPVYVDGKDTGVAVYVASSRFRDIVPKDVILQIADRLNISK